MTIIDDSLLEKQNKPLSVLEMKQVKEGPVTGYGRVVAVGEQFQAVSQINAVCNGLIPCACDVSDGEHERHCGYTLHVDFTLGGKQPPSPVIISLFDPGNGKPQVCPRCKGSSDFEVKLEYRRAKLVRLQDVDNRTDNARQDVILYDEMVDNLAYNEIVQIEGNMYVQRKPGSSKNSMMDTILHATMLKYLKRPDVIVTDKDIELFYKWKEVCLKAQAKEIASAERFKRQAKEYNCIACQQLARKIVPMSLVNRQAAALAPNIIGHLPPKQGMLRTLAGGTKRGPGRLKGKIQTLFIGDKGTSKSSLGEEGGRIHPNSAKVTATHATGKAVTGVVDNETKMLVLGALPASDYVLLDEIDKLPIEEQSRLLGILEENHFGKDAYGLHYEIDTDVAIVATANPTNTDWIDSQRVSTAEIGLIPTLKDRFTQIFIFRDDLKTKDKRLEFARKFAAKRKKGQPNYSFFRKLWIYASGIKPEISEEADKMLHEFWANQDTGGVELMDTRFLSHIYKIAEAEAKLNLSEIVTEHIADESQKAIMVMLVQYGEEIKTVSKPSDVVFNKCLEILENTENGILVEELCRLVANEDTQIAAYLGNKRKISDTRKIQKLVSRLVRHPNVKVIREKPKVLQWTDNSGLSGAYGAYEGVGEQISLTNKVFSRSEKSYSTVQNQQKVASDTPDTPDSNSACRQCGGILDSEPYYAKFHRCKDGNFRNKI